MDPEVAMPELTYLTTVLVVLRDRWRQARAAGDRGSVTLEQVAIAAGLLAIAVAAVAVIGRVVVKYTGKLN
jgi:hypothetical protein